VEKGAGVMRQLGARLAWRLREAAWEVDERVLWPASDAIQYLPSEDGARQIPRGSWWQRHGLDLAIAAGLAVAAFLLRRHGLPTDGLWLDDSVQAAALPASPSDLLAVSVDRPGYTALLIGWRALGGGSDAALTYPTLAAGALGPALLYLALRYCGYERSIGVLLGGALAVAATDVVYSARVKTYTIDVLIVLGLALVIPRLTRIRWRWWIGLAWIAAAAVLAFWSGFGLIAVAVAGPIIVLHPHFDFRLRLVAVTLQESICIVFLAVENHSHDVATLQEEFRTKWDGFIDFNTPTQFASDVFVHFRRVAEYFVGSSHWLAALCIVATIVGLAVAAWEGRQAVRARYLLLLLLTAFVAGVAGKFPFGPSQGFLVSSGGRVSLWLIPVVAIGLAAALQGVRGLLPDRLPRLFDATAWVAAALILVTGASRDPVSYPFPGAQSATRFIQSQLGDRDAVLVGYRSDWSYAAESGLHSGIERTPETSVGFQPTFDDPRVHRVDAPDDAHQVAARVGQADRVFVYHAERPFFGAEQQLRTQLAATLGALDFRPQQTRTFGDATVQVWQRRGTKAPLPSNLAASDLPAGWTLHAPPSPSPANRILACVHASPAGGSTNVMAATSPTQLNVISQLDQWPSKPAASLAVSAVRGPRGAACVRSVVAQLLASVGLPLDVSVDHERPPAAAGPHAVAYHVLARNRGTPVAQGSALLFARGRTSAQILLLRSGNEPISQAFVAQLAATLAQRMGGSP
jgi:hypothetical protein